MPPPKNSLFSARWFFSQNMLVRNWASNSLSAASMPVRGSVSAIGRVERRSRRVRRTHDRAAQIAQHLRVGQRQLNHFFERHVPVLGRALGRDRPRMRRGQRFVGVRLRAGRLGRILDLGRHLFVDARRHARFERLARVPAAAARQDHRRGQQQRQEFASAIHAMHARPAAAPTRGEQRVAERQRGTTARASSQRTSQRREKWKSLAPQQNWQQMSGRRVLGFPAAHRPADPLRNVLGLFDAQSLRHDYFRYD